MINMAHPSPPPPDGQASLSPVAGGAAAPVGQKPRWVLIVAALLLALTACLRSYRLGSLPGINGDEAWLGTQVAHALRGEPFSWRTITGNWINPFFWLMESVLLGALPPDLLLLRVPAALLAGVGGVASAWLGRWLYASWEEGVLLAVVTLSLPLHLAYSRLGWDPSFVLFTAPLLLLPAARLAEPGATRREWALVGAGAFFSVWVHLSSLIVVALVLVCLALVRAPAVVRALRGRGRSGQRVAGGGVAAAVSTALLIGGGLMVLRLQKVSVGLALKALGAGAVALVQDPGRTAEQLLQFGAILAGGRGHAFLAGTPASPLAQAGASLCTALFVVLSLDLGLRRGGRGGDRLLGLLGMAALLLVMIGFEGVFGLAVLGHERYLLWLVPLFALILTRGLLVRSRLVGGGEMGRVVLLLFAAAGLCSTWTGYFRPLLSQTYASTLDRTFWTGPREPKAEAAALIRSAFPPGSAPGPEERIVIVEDWSLHQTLRFLLEPEFTVQAPQEADLSTLPPVLIVVGWADRGFVAKAAEAITSWGRGVERRSVAGVDGRPLLTVVIAATGE